MIGRIQEAWSAETSFWPMRWTPDRPSIGQCAVTAFLVQELLGGEVWCCPVPIIGYGSTSHYWNTLADGARLDLTADQFEAPPSYQGFLSERDEVLKGCLGRYELLRARVLGGAA